MPPRHSKSLHVSQLFPSYVVGKNPNDPVIVASYSGDLATDHGRETRNIIDGELYQNLFSTRLAPDSSAKGKWNTVVEENGETKNAKGAYNAAGVGGSITGKGAKFFIIDDPHKDRKEADSQVIREAVWNWYKTVVRTRLTPDGAIIITHTRWHQADLIGKLTEGEDAEPWVDYFDYLQGKTAKWVRLRLQAVATKEEPYRKEGEALWPTRYNMTELEDIKKTLGPYEFSALYQANPVDDSKREFKKEWIKPISLEEVNKKRTRKFASIDTNLKKSDASDFTGVTRNYVDELNNWHIRSTRYRVNSKEILDLVFLLHAEGFEIIGIEEGAFTYVVQPFLEEEMKKRGQFPNVVPLKHNQTMKEVRIRGLQPRYAAGAIYHIEGTCSDLEEEMMTFPNGTYDDCLDSEAYQIQIAETLNPIPEVQEHMNRNEVRMRLNSTK